MLSAKTINYAHHFLICIGIRTCRRLQALAHTYTHRQRQTGTFAFWRYWLFSFILLFSFMLWIPIAAAHRSVACAILHNGNDAVAFNFDASFASDFVITRRDFCYIYDVKSKTSFTCAACGVQTPKCATMMERMIEWNVFSVTLYDCTIRRTANTVYAVRVLSIDAISKIFFCNWGNFYAQDVLCGAAYAVRSI